MTRSNDDARRKVLAALTPIEREAAKCQKCKLALTRTRSVFGKGNPLARLVVLGEGPGADEDKDGIPFRGKAGKLLHRGLEAIGHDDTNTYFCNILKCRACDIMDSGWAKNRTPDSTEISNCAPFLRRQLEALPNKKVILAVGSTAMHWLLQADPGTIRIGNARGKFLETPFSEVVGVATYHPSFLLRDENAEMKASVYEDFKLARDLLAGKFGEYFDLDLKSRYSFNGSDWAAERDKPLPRGKAAEREREEVQKPGKLLESQQDRYTTKFEVWGDGGTVVEESVQVVSPKGAGTKLVFGSKVQPLPKKGKEVMKSSEPTVFDPEEDDIPF